MKKILFLAQQQWEGFGYEGFADFWHSSFHPKSLHVVSLISGWLAFLAVPFEEWIGMKPIVYLAFITLGVIEFITGIKAAIKERKKIKSRKISRMIIKLGTYTVLIALMNIFKNHLEIPSVAGIEVDIYSWIYYAIVNLVVIQLLISVLENFGRLGFAETNMITKFLYAKLRQWFDVDERRPRKRIDEEGDNSEQDEDIPPAEFTDIDNSTR